MRCNWHTGNFIWTSIVSQARYCELGLTVTIHTIQFGCCEDHGRSGTEYAIHDKNATIWPVDHDQCSLVTLHCEHNLWHDYRIAAYHNSIDVTFMSRKGLSTLSWPNIPQLDSKYKRVKLASVWAKAQHTCTLAVASQAPDTNVFWSGPSERLITSPVWPSNLVTSWPDSISHRALRRHEYTTNTSEPVNSDTQWGNLPGHITRGGQNPRVLKEPTTGKITRMTLQLLGYSNSTLPGAQTVDRADIVQTTYATKIVSWSWVRVHYKERKRGWINLPQATKLPEGAYAQVITQLDLSGIACT